MNIETPEDLIRYFNSTFEFDKWPKEFKVSPSLYGKVCQYIFNINDNELFWGVDWGVDSGKESSTIIAKTILLGPNKGVMFKNVELIIEAT